MEIGGRASQIASFDILKLGTIQVYNKYQILFDVWLVEEL